MKNKKKRKISLATVGYAFREIIWPRKYLLLLGLVLIIINRLSGLVLPGSSKYLIDEVIGKGDHELLVLLIIVVSIAVAVSDCQFLFSHQIAQRGSPAFNFAITCSGTATYYPAAHQLF